MAMDELPLELIDYILESDLPAIAWAVGADCATLSRPMSELALSDNYDHVEGANSSDRRVRPPHLENKAMKRYIGHSTRSLIDYIEDAGPLLGLLDAIDADPSNRKIPRLKADGNSGEANVLAISLRWDDPSRSPALTLWRISRHRSLLVLTATFDSNPFDPHQARLAAAAEHAPVGMLVTDLHMNMLWANDEWLKTVGMPKDADLNSWGSLIHPEDHSLVHEYRDRCVANRKRDSCEFRWLPIAGENSETWTVSNVDTIKDRNGQPCGFVGLLANVARWKSDELKMLREREATVTARLRAEQAVLALSQEREAHARKAAEEAENRRAEAVQEKKATELFLDVASHELRNPISAILQNAEFTRSSMDDLRASMERLKSAGQLPHCFSQSTIEQIEEDIEACDAIIQCGHAQERIANDILGLAQIQLSKYTIASIEFDLPSSLRNICRMWKNESKAKGITLELSIGTSLKRLGPQARVFADPTRLAQVLVNLLSNAVRFTAKSKVRKIVLSVEVSGVPPKRGGEIVPPKETEYYIEKQRPVYLFFSVADTGPGMTEEETSRLFEKFTQASPFTHSTMGGSGLGLWIARNLCELQAGAIEVKSRVGEGSVFRCFITARSVDAGSREQDHDAVPVIEGITEAGPNGAAPKLTVTDDPRSSRNDSSPDQTVLPLAGRTILCCEDNQINRTVLRKQLLKAGAAEVLLAENGQEGLNMLHTYRGRVACIIMDFEMPVLDGLGAVKQIRVLEEREKSKRMRIVGLTGNARDAQVQMGLDAGMDDVVTKPYRVPDLLRRILNEEEERK